MGFLYFDVIRDKGLEKFVFEVVLDDAQGVFGYDALAIAGDDGAKYLYVGIQVGTHGVNGFFQESDPFQREVFRADGDQNILAGDQGIYCQKAQRWGSVNENDVVIKVFDFVLKNFFSANELGDL